MHAVTGIFEFDNLFGRLTPGLTLVVGEASAGKTSFLMQAAQVNAYMYNNVVVIHDSFDSIISLMSSSKRKTIIVDDLQDKFELPSHTAIRKLAELSKKNNNVLITGLRCNKDHLIVGNYQLMPEAGAGYHADRIISLNKQDDGFFDIRLKKNRYGKQVGVRCTLDENGFVFFAQLST